MKRFPWIFGTLLGVVGAVSVWGEPAPTAPAVSTPAATTPATTAPSSLVPGSRIVHTFDFEERKLGNFETVPMHWLKVKDRGYPSYATGKLVNDVYRSADTSFRLDIDGGSVAYQLAAGRIPINPNADYYILGFVRTTPMKNARAEISAWFADEKGNLIRQSVGHSTRFASSTEPGTQKGDPEWQVLHLFMPGQDMKNARSLVLQMGLLQPQQLSNGGLGKFDLYQQDIKGTAWFDDIVVFQLPRLSIKCPPAPLVTGNVFGPGQKVELDLTVSDLGRDKLSAKVTLKNAEGRVVAADEWAFAVDANTPWEKRWTQPPLPPGLYTATLDVFDSNSLIARRQTRIVTLAQGRIFDKPSPEFGVVATDWPVEAWSELPAILRHMGVGLVQLPAWRKEMSDDSLLRRDQPFDALINSLGRLEIHTLASFSEIPTALTEKLTEKPAGSPASPSGLALRPASDSILSLLEADQSVWRPYVSFLLARYSNRVDLWQLGSQGDASGGGDRFYSTDPRYPKLYAKTYAELATLLNHPQLLIPWNALYDFDPKVYPRAVLNLRLPSLIKPGQIPSYLANFADDAVSATRPAVDGASKRPLAAPNVIALIEPLDEVGYSRIDRLTDFAQRVVYARSANPRAILIDLPISRRSSLGNHAAYTEPEELLVVYRTLAKSLGGATYTRELPLGNGVHAYLFGREGSSILAIWSDSARPSQLDLPLGPRPRMLDIFGNASPLKVDAATALTSVTLTSTPILIEQVDSRMLELKCSFGLAEANFPAGLGSMRNFVLLSNPYQEPLNGTLQLQAPKGWAVDPPSFTLSILPGASLRQEVVVRFPFAEFSGALVMKARLRTDTGAEVDLSVPITVTSTTVEMEGFAQVVFSPNASDVEGQGAELVVQQMITNISTNVLNAQSYALVPGFARQQRFVLELRPGQTVIKRFTFPLASMTGAKGDANEAMRMLAGKSVAIGLRQNDGRTLVTKSIPLD